MNRRQRRASLAVGRSLQKKEWTEFEDVTDEAYRKSASLRGSPQHRPDRVLQNTQYVVQVFFGRKVLGMPATKLMIRRSDAKPVTRWMDLQRIKNEIYGNDAEAIQVFPKQTELVDDANVYWLWVLEKHA